MKPDQSRWPLLAMLLVFSCSALAFWGLDRGSLMAWDEALTGERVREMVEEGHWWTPHLFGIPDFNKPPLYYWLSALVWKITGPGEFAVRFWSVVFALLSAAVVYLRSVRIGLDRAWGVLASLLILLNPFWQNWTRLGLLDSGTILSVLLAIYWLDHPTPSRRSALWAGMALAAGSLLKNPLVLLAVPAAGVGIWFRTRRLDWRRLGAATAIPLATVAVWSVVQLVLHGQAWWDFQVYNSVGRFTTNIEGHATEISIFWSRGIMEFPRVAIVMAGAALGAAFIRFRGTRRIAAELVFGTVWLALILSSASKRPVYLVPFLPAAALVTVSFLAAICTPRIRYAVVGAISVFLLFGFLPHLDRYLDYSSSTSQIGRFVHRELTADSFLMTTDRREAHILAFYTHRIPERLKADQVKDWAKQLDPQSQHGGFLVLTKETADQAEKDLVAAVGDRFSLEKLMTRGPRALFSLQPWSPEKGVPLRYGRGWNEAEHWGRWICAESATIEAASVELPAQLVVKATSWSDQTQPQVCQVKLEGEVVGSFEVETKPWQWQEFFVDIPGQSTGPLTITLEFLHRFKDQKGRTERSLPVADIRLVPQN